jgi:hypothetical protein
MRSAFFWFSDDAVEGAAVSCSRQGIGGQEAAAKFPLSHTGLWSIRLTLAVFAEKREMVSVKSSLVHRGSEL